MISISFSGDLRLLNPGSVFLSSGFKSILDSCDYNVLNFEVPIQKKGTLSIKKSGPSLSQNEMSPMWVKDNGWNVVSLANNHALDYGEESLDYTIGAFSDIIVIGAGKWDNAYCVKIIEVKQKKIGIIACTQHEFGILDDRNDVSKIGCAWINHPEIIKKILKVKEDVDFLIMYAHAGVENFFQPLPEWREIYRFFIDLGCDAVIGSHPHVIQGWELYQDKPIFYSLGNLCFQKNKLEKKSWYESLCVVLNIEENNRLSFEVNYILYNQQKCEISLVNMNDLSTKLYSLNRILNDEDMYNDYINRNLPNEWNNYLHLFANSGFVHRFASGDMLSVLKNRIFNKDNDYSHILNNLQNESHRWAIERIIRLKNGIKY